MPQQNGVSEKMNRSILDSARAMAYDAVLTKKMALQNKTPAEMWYEHKPDLS